MKKLKNKNKGITLIALVITIIVMLILVAVTISMAVNGGLFEYAGKATKDTQNSIDKEGELGSGKVTIDNVEYNSIDEYLNTQKGGFGNEGEDLEEFTALYSETKNYTDKNGKTAVIPKGFSVGKSEGINTIDDGLVIQDAKENQFVWIPVEYTASGMVDENGLDSGFLEVFKKIKSSKEPTANGYEGEVAEYYEMMLSVQENKGFYIGRFEAGTEEPRCDGIANGTDELVIKRDAYPYNYVAWGKTMSDYESIIKWDFDNNEVNDETGLDQGHGAVYLSKHLLDEQETEATSTLCYGVQWDAMLKFMGKAEETDSTEWGNYYTNDYTITRITAKYSENIGATWKLIDDEAGDSKSKSVSDRFFLTTGACDEFKLKNIYDVAGNAAEWTMESTTFQWTDLRVFRGGSTHDNNTYLASKLSNDLQYICKCDISFRTALYIE